MSQVHTHLCLWSRDVLRWSWILTGCEFRRENKVKVSALFRPFTFVWLSINLSTLSIWLWEISCTNSSWLCCVSNCRAKRTLVYLHRSVSPCAQTRVKFVFQGQIIKFSEALLRELLLCYVRYEFTITQWSEIRTWHFLRQCIPLDNAVHANINSKLIFQCETDLVFIWAYLLLI